MSILFLSHSILFLLNLSSMSILRYFNFFPKLSIPNEYLITNLDSCLVNSSLCHYYAIHHVQSCMSIGGADHPQFYLGNNMAYAGKMTAYVFLTCLLASLGGLLFGYDIGVSGGVTSMDSFLKKFFPSVYWKVMSETSTSQYCKFDSQLLTAFTSSLYLAAFVASFFVPMVTRRHGRKVSMLFGGAVFLCGAILNGVALNVVMLILGRILLGVGVGFTNHVISFDFSNFLLL